LLDFFCASKVWFSKDFVLASKNIIVSDDSFLFAVALFVMKDETLKILNVVNF